MKNETKKCTINIYEDDKISMGYLLLDLKIKSLADLQRMLIKSYKENAITEAKVEEYFLDFTEEKMKTPIDILDDVRNRD